MKVQQAKNILVLGATGHFGGRIARRLAGEVGAVLTVTSRTDTRAAFLAASIEKANPGITLRSVSLDQFGAHFEDDLAVLAPDIVIHTAGPYQGQNYRVAEACIACGSHYIDLADGRDFVVGFSELHEHAKDAGVLLVTGASTLPGLSSAVVDYYKNEFRSIEKISLSIAPAHQTPRGMSTITAVLSYCGKPFDVLEDGEWNQKYGWQHMRTVEYPSLGKRWAAACDVPDLALLPERYPNLRTATFHAALEARWEQAALWLMAGLARIGLVSGWSKLIPTFHFFSEKLINLGSDRGGMHIRLDGRGQNGEPKSLSWFITAENNHGPEIPCSPALIVARKLLKGEISQRGAMPCMGLFSLQDFDDEVRDLRISWERRG